MFRSKLFRFLLILLLLLLLAVGLYYLGLWLHWPLWFVASVYGGIVGLCVLAALLHRWYFRHRERRFVERVVRQDLSRLPQEEEEQQNYKDMEKRFLAAVDVLKTSEMSKKGNPLYVLPWCMVLGESNSGKTMALRRANLLAIQTQFNSIGSPTSSCDWWFSNSEVILDMAGRFSEADCGEDTSVRREWETFLTLLAKHRQREPLNALVVAVSAERLGGDAEQLDNYARLLRRRINELMRVVGARFPIYVLVTKMDLVPGFNAFTDQIDMSARGQVMGSLNCEDLPGDRFAHDCLDHFVGIMNDFRIMAANAKPDFDLSLLSLPGHLARFQGPLQRFSSILFSANPYLETPFFRGLFFSSAKANDEKFANNPMATNRGAFLHDIFSKIIPRDRYLFTPVREMLHWRTVSGLLGWGAWMLVCLGVSCLLTLSFVENRKALNILSDQFAPFAAVAKATSGSVENRLLPLDQISRGILNMEMVNRNWRIPRLGLTQSIEGEQRIKEYYGHLFAGTVQHPSDLTLLRNINAVNASTPEAVIPIYIEHLVWRMNVLQKGIDGASLEDMERVPAPMRPALFRQGLGLPAKSGPVYTSLYLRNLAWNSGSQNFEEQLRTWQNALADLVSFRGGRLDWLVGWANEHPLLRPVTMSEFWGNSQFILRKDTLVPAAYTVRGREAIADFLDKIRDSSRDKESFRMAEKAFWESYADQYFASWYNFALSAPTGQEIVAPTEEMRLVSGQMSGYANPYFALLERMNEELRPMALVTDTPPWYGTVQTFNMVLREIRLKKTPASIGKVLSDTSHTVDKLSASMDPAQREQAMQLAQVTRQLEEYQKAVNALLPAISSPATSFQFVSKVLRGPDVASGVSFQIHNAKRSLDAFVRTVCGTRGTPEILQRLVGGPYLFFHSLLLRQSLEELQRIWVADVYTVAEETPVEKQYHALCDAADGAIPAFLKGSGQPFVIKRGKRYTAASFLGTDLPLTSTFLGSLTCPARQPLATGRQHRVRLLAEPTTVNREARDIPFLTTVSLMCQDRPVQTLENYNNRVSRNFTWSFDECNEARLDIHLRTVTLRKEFHGPGAFPELLRMFRSGRVTFRADDFPAYEEELRDLGITSLSTGMKMSGAGPVINFIEVKKMTLPQRITSGN